MTMRAQVIEDYCDEPNFKHIIVDKPKNLGDKQILINVKAVSLNRGDSIIRKGYAKMVFNLKMPCTLGLEGSGTVAEVGAGVTKFKVGDDVVLLYQDSKTGTCAEYAVCEEDEVIHKPSHMSHQEASSIATAGCTALAMFKTHPKIKDVIDKEIEHTIQFGKLSDAPQERPDLTIIVIGASGGCGTYVVLFAKNFLSRYFNVKVYAVCSGKNVDMVTSLGADVVIDYNKTSAKDGPLSYHPTDGKSELPSICEVVKQHGDDYVDMVLDCVGGYYYYDDACRNMCKAGRDQVIYSSIAPPGICKVTMTTLFQLGYWITSNKVKSYFAGHPSYYFVTFKINNKDHEFVTRYVFADCAKKVPITEFSLADIQKAHQLLDTSRAVGKIVLII